MDNIPKPENILEIRKAHINGQEIEIGIITHDSKKYAVFIQRDHMLRVLPGPVPEWLDLYLQEERGDFVKSLRLNAIHVENIINPDIWDESPTKPTSRR